MGNCLSSVSQGRVFKLFAFELVLKYEEVKSKMGPITGMSHLSPISWGGHVSDIEAVSHPNYGKN